MPCLNNCNNPRRICIETDRVFDIAAQRLPQRRVLTISFTGDPAGYTITEMRATDAIISNLVLSPIPNSINTRVRYTLTVPLTLTAVNNVGLHITGTSSVTIENDIIMRLPPGNAAIPVRIEASASITGLIPAPLSETVELEFCLIVVTRVVAKVVLVICSYGYPEVPPAQEFEPESICPGANFPIFPFTTVL